MFCSTVIATIARPTLSRAVCSVLDQKFAVDDFEIIVVNDTGKPLPEADWHQSERVRIIHTNQRTQSVARNTGAAIAEGKYLHFLDDDDWILPGALENFWQLSQSAQDAAWLYGRTQLVDRKEKYLIQLDHNMNGNIFVQVMAGEWIPLLASLIESKTFFDIGGFNPLMSVSEDVDLCRRVALHGNMASMSALVACYSTGLEGSSSPRHLDSERSRWGREKILNKSGVLMRMRDSANSSYWHGRIVRIYLTSIAWNLFHKHLFIAVSRAVFGLASFVLAGRHILSKNFWRALIKNYESETFSRGFQKANLLNDREIHKQHNLVQ